MSKLYVSCIVVALLALAVMPAIAATGPLSSGDSREVVVTATVPEYINMDAEDLTIEFGELADGSNVGYVQSDAASDTASYTISTNVPLWATYANGSDLALDGASDGYKMELQFSVKAWGWIDWLGGTTYGQETGAGYSGWGGCGADGANATGADPAGQAEQALTDVGIQACQAFTAETRAQLYQNGINDPAGSYSQVAGDLLTLTLYTSDPQ